jgi:amino acid transporter
MSYDDVEKVHKAETGKIVVSPAYDAMADNEDYYDPSKESMMTRAGLNFESFKRAPGTTR